MADQDPQPAQQNDVQVAVQDEPEQAPEAQVPVVAEVSNLEPIYSTSFKK